MIWLLDSQVHGSCGHLLKTNASSTQNSIISGIDDPQSPALTEQLLAVGSLSWEGKWFFLEDADTGNAITEDADTRRFSIF